MRKISRLLILALLVCAILAVNCCVANATVKTSQKKGVFTVSGKGKMKSSQIPSSKNKKKIKKVIIKKGVTSIPKNAFRNCINLKTVKISSTVKSLGEHAFCGTGIKTLVIPKKVKVIHENLFEDCRKLETVTLRGDFTLKKKVQKGDPYPSRIVAKTFVFSTPLALKNVTYLKTNNIKVSAKDPTFSSIKGVLYSKDKKTLVRVPSNRKTLTVEKGCVNIAAAALTYVWDSWRGPGSGIVCTDLKTLNIPSSVKVVSRDLYPETLKNAPYVISHIEKINGGDGLSGEAFSNLLMITSTGTLRKLVDEARTKGYLTEDGKMTIYKGDHLLMLAPDEEEEEIVIPDNIRSIGAGMFGIQLDYDGVVEKHIHIGTLSGGRNVRSIGYNAFAYVGGLHRSITIDHIALENE